MQHVTSTKLCSRLLFMQQVCSESAVQTSKVSNTATAMHSNAMQMCGCPRVALANPSTARAGS